MIDVRFSLFPYTYPIKRVGYYSGSAPHSITPISRALSQKRFLSARLPADYRARRGRLRIWPPCPMRRWVYRLRSETRRRRFLKRFFYNNIIPAAGFRSAPIGILQFADFPFRSISWRGKGGGPVSKPMHMLDGCEPALTWVPDQSPSTNLHWSRKLAPRWVHTPVFGTRLA